MSHFRYVFQIFLLRHVCNTFQNRNTNLLSHCLIEYFYPPSFYHAFPVIFLDDRNQDLFVSLN